MTSPSDLDEEPPRARATATKGRPTAASSPAAITARAFPTCRSRAIPASSSPSKGTDGVGRSTQIQLLREWLEIKGYGVVETGWTRSPLMQPTIELAKSSNTLNKLTFVLLYATDFADRLEKGNHSGAQGRVHRPVGSVHLHGARARRRARHRSAVAAEPLRLRDRAAHGVLPEDRRRQADRPRPRIARHGLLGIGDGS